MLAWTVCIGCLVRACSRETAYPPNRDRLYLPRGKSPGFDGLPYKFYQRFWDQLGPELIAVLSEAFQPNCPASLPADMTEGCVTLLYEGKGADRAQPALYRPITLLNTDYKLAKKTKKSSQPVSSPAG